MFILERCHQQSTEECSWGDDESLAQGSSRQAWHGGMDSKEIWRYIVPELEDQMQRRDLGIIEDSRF